MRFAVVLNRDGGTLRTLDMATFSARLEELLQEVGHTVEIALCPGAELCGAIDRAVASEDADVVMVGGGDGTASAAAARLMGKPKALAVLPAGTMNLFARSLGIPLDLEAAIKAHALGKKRQVDIATANGQPFVHQFSLGMHAKLVRLRDDMSFNSRLSKIRASTRAAVDALLQPPRLRLKLTLDEQELRLTTSSLGVTNNLFGEGHLPYTDEPAGGRLGVYVTRAQTTRELLTLGTNMLLGRWRTNSQVEIHEARRVVVEVVSGGKRFGSALDGELMDMEKRTEILMHPGALQVIVPDPEQG
jgi:diacylglycerol kinase family enzyme